MRAVSLLRASDPKLRYVAAELVLELARHCYRAPAPANGPSGPSFNGAPGVAKAMIQAGGLLALWGVCSDPSPMARPVALSALATLLGTSAAMSRTAASSEAVLALMYADVVGRLGRDFVEPALTSRAAGPQGGGRGVGGSGAAFSVATSALLALHFLAANPDPDVFGLFLAAAGADDAGEDIDGGGFGGGSGGGPASTWGLILSSVESAAGSAGAIVEKGGDASLLEAAMLAAGSVCGAPPLPPGGRGSRGADEVTRILPTYQARAETPGCAAAASFAAAGGLAARSMALLTAVADSGDVSQGGGVGFPSESGLLSGSGSESGGSNAGEADASSVKVGRAGIRVVWALSRASSPSATLAARGTLPRLMDLMSARRRRGGGGVRDDAAAGVLVLETIAAFLTPDDAGGANGGGGGGGAAAATMQGNQSPSRVSAETAGTIGRTIEELWDLVLDDNPTQSPGGRGGGETEVATVADSLVPRSLALLAGVAEKPRLRPLLVDSTRFNELLNLLVVDKRLDGASSSVSAHTSGSVCEWFSRGLFCFLVRFCGGLRTPVKFIFLTGFVVFLVHTVDASSATAAAAAAVAVAAAMATAAMAAAMAAVVVMSAGASACRQPCRRLVAMTALVFLFFSSPACAR